MLRDGRVGFIDFGIVGRISPVTWQAVQALLLSTGTRDFDTMARALATMGVTSQDVDIPVSRHCNTQHSLTARRHLKK